MGKLNNILQNFLKKPFDYIYFFFIDDGFAISVNRTLELTNDTVGGFFSYWNHASMVKLYFNYYDH